MVLKKMLFYYNEILIYKQLFIKLISFVQKQTSTFIKCFVKGIILIMDYKKYCNNFKDV